MGKYSLIRALAQLFNRLFTALLIHFASWPQSWDFIFPFWSFFTRKTFLSLISPFFYCFSFLRSLHCLFNVHTERSAFLALKISCDDSSVFVFSFTICTQPMTLQNVYLVSFHQHRHRCIFCRLRRSLKSCEHCNQLLGELQSIHGMQGETLLAESRAFDYELWGFMGELCAGYVKNLSRRLRCKSSRWAIRFDSVRCPRQSPIGSPPINVLIKNLHKNWLNVIVKRAHA